MNKGCCSVKIIYPGYIALKEGKYIEINTNEKTSYLIIYRHIDALELIDQTNQLEIDSEGVINLNHPLEHHSDKINRITADAGSKEIGLMVDIVEDTNNRIFKPRHFTEILIKYEVENIESITEEEARYFFEALALFISWYRFYSQDSMIQELQDLINDYPLYLVNITSYDENDLKKTLKDRVLKPLPSPSLFNVRYEENILEEISRKTHSIPSLPHNFEMLLAQALRMGEDLPLDKSLLCKATEERILNKNYRHAVLDCFMAAEIAIGTFLEKKKIERGISRKKIKEYDKQAGISYKLNIELPAYLTGLDDAKREVIGNVDKLRKLRNSIVHEGFKDISEQMVAEGISAVGGLVSLIDSQGLPLSGRPV